MADSSLRWDPGTWLLANLQLAKFLAESGPEVFGCTVGTEVVEERGKKVGYLRVWNESGKPVFSRNLGFPCPGPGCPE